MVGEILYAHLRRFPTWQREVDAVEKGHIFPDRIRQWGEKMGGAHHHFYRLIRVTEHGDRCRSRYCVLPSSKGARLTVRFQGGDDLFRHLLQVCYLVKGDSIPQANQPDFPCRHVIEEVGNSRWTRQENGVRVEFLVGIGFTSSARAKFHKVVVRFAQGDQPDQKQQLEPPLEMRWFEADTAHQQVDPLVGAQLVPTLPVVFEVESG